MTVDDQIIVTPADDALFYDFDWRYLVAHHAIRSKKLPSQAGDSIVRTYIRYLKSVRRRDEEAETFRRAESLHADASWQTIIRACLLTNTGTAQIADDLGLPASAISCYERLFFNVRNDEDRPIKAQVLRMALKNEVEAGEQERCRFINLAIKGGYVALIDNLPSITTSSESRLTAAELVDRELHRRIMRGDMRTCDLIRLKSIHVNEDRMLHETGQKGAPDKGMELVRDILQLLAPKVAGDNDTNADAESAIARLLKAERSIAETELNDLGPMAGAAEINAQIAAKFKHVRT